jgi:hypothetical protein
MIRDLSCAARTQVWSIDVLQQNSNRDVGGLCWRGQKMWTLCSVELGLSERVY